MATQHSLVITPTALRARRQQLYPLSQHFAVNTLPWLSEDLEEGEQRPAQIVAQYCRQMAQENHCQVSLRQLLGPAPLSREDPNEYFDQIFILNLEQRPDRWAHMVQRCREVGIWHYQRWPAIYGREEPHCSEWERYRRLPMTTVEKNRYQRRGIQSVGSWAILKSTWLMLRAAQAAGYRRILIFQDDLLFHKEFRRLFAATVPMLPEDWRLWYLGATQHNWTHTRPYRQGKATVSNWLRQGAAEGGQKAPVEAGLYHPNGTADGAFGVAIDCSLYAELMALILEFKLPVDSGPLKTCQRKYADQCVVSLPNLVIADIRDSDLRNSRDLTIYSQRFRWDLSQYHIVDDLVH